MRAGPITARDEGRPLAFDAFERSSYVFRSLHARWVGLRSNENKVIVHNRISPHPLPFGEEFLFSGLRVDEHNVCIATSAGIERLTGSLCHDFYFNSGLGLEHREDMIEQPRVLR